MNEAERKERVQELYRAYVKNATVDRSLRPSEEFVDDVYLATSEIQAFCEHLSETHSSAAIVSGLQTVYFNSVSDCMPLPIAIKTFYHLIEMLQLKTDRNVAGSA